MGHNVTVGDKAPSFTLSDQHGETVTLENLLHRGPVVVFFYPKDETTVCTAEACAFRDSHEDFVAAGAQVVGISSDSVSSHQSFGTRHRLPYRLLSDEGGKVRQSWGVPRTLGLLPGRVTYVLDDSGTVRHLFSAQLAADRHTQEALATVRTLAHGSPSSG